MSIVCIDRTSSTKEGFQLRPSSSMADIFQCPLSSHQLTNMGGRLPFVLEQKGKLLKNSRRIYVQIDYTSEVRLIAIFISNHCSSLERIWQQL